MLQFYAWCATITMIGLATLQIVDYIQRKEGSEDG